MTRAGRQCRRQTEHPARD